MKFEIKHRLSGAILFSLETENMRLCVEAAIKARADLARADLAGAYLAGANLARADLARADLAGAYLAGANLARANLAGANLAGAYLAGAYLAGANLAGANGKKLTLIGERPYFAIGPIGSRSATLQAFLTDGGVYVSTGCFWDTLDAFKAAVLETHGPIGLHFEEYEVAIRMIEWHSALWTPKPEAAEKAA